MGYELTDPLLKDYAKRLAARAVLRRAASLVGPIRPAARRIYEPLREMFRGELDVERTLDNALGKPRPEPRDWVMMRREEKNPQVALMMDVSLSMSGRNLALAALACAVLALKVKSADLAVVVFDSSARALSHLNHSFDREALVGEILAQPARGYTNIREALEVGGRELAAGRNPEKTALLITDGVYTVGGDPLPRAARFPRLFVLLTEDYKMNPDLCRRLALAGKGEVFRVQGFEDLPRRMLETANRILR
jgi:Mg-chelatase subunit ChlD